MSYPFLAAATTVAAIEFFTWKQNWMKHCLYCVILAVGVVLAMLPLLTNDFLFMDDLYGPPSTCFEGISQYNLGAFIHVFRPLAVFPNLLFTGVGFQNSHVARCIAAGFLVLFSLLLYFWIFYYTGRRLFSMVLSFGICVNVSAADLLGPICINPMLIGICFSALSVILYTKSHNTEDHVMRCILIVSSVVALFLSFNEYAIATPIIFLFFSIRLWYREYKRSIFNELVGYAVIMLISVIVYIMFARFTVLYYQVSAQESRSELIISLGQIISRTLKFLTIILPQCSYRILVSIMGMPGGMHNTYFQTDISTEYGNFAVTLVSLLAVASFVGLWFHQKKQILPVLIGIGFLFFSYYPFFVLPDDTYMSYYAYPMLSMLFFLSLSGIDNILKYCFKNTLSHNKGKAMKTATMLMVTCLVVQVNQYCSQVWVNYCTTGQTLMKNAIYLGRDTGVLDQTNRVHIYGTVMPVAIRSYPILLAQHILEEVGYHDVVITQSDTNTEILTLMESDWQSIQEHCTKKEIALINRFYNHSSYYNFYSRNESIMNNEEQTLMISAFQKAGLLPGEEACAVVELRELINLAEF